MRGRAWLCTAHTQRCTTLPRGGGGRVWVVGVVVLAVVEHYHFLCCSTAVTQHTFCNYC